MDTMLVLITGLSLALAGVMSLLVWTMVRDERRRSDARVAALRDLAADDVETSPPIVTAPHPGSPLRAEQASHAPADLPLRVRGDASPALFVGPSARPSWGPRIALAAGVLAIACGIGFTYWPGSATDVRPPSAVPLELLTLEHASSPGTLRVSGIVRNPRDGAPVRRIVATAYALSADGTVVASGRAPIDVVTFGPGEESPFQVSVAVTGPVARYRVGFRDDGGRVVAHVDRRAADESVAQK